MVTPTSQLVATQAVLNVVQGERYRTIPTEVVKYALGHYGAPLAPVAPDVMDRIMSMPEARRLAARAPLPPMVERVRARPRAGVSHDELMPRQLLARGPREPIQAR